MLKVDDSQFQDKSEFRSAFESVVKINNPIMLNLSKKHCLVSDLLCRSP